MWASEELYQDCSKNLLLCFMLLGFPSTLLGRRKMHAGLWWENLKKRVHLKDLGVHGRVILKWILMKLDERMWSGLI